MRKSGNESNIQSAALDNGGKSSGMSWPSLGSSGTVDGSFKGKSESPGTAKATGWGTCGKAYGWGKTSQTGTSEVKSRLTGWGNSNWNWS